MRRRSAEKKEDKIACRVDRGTKKLKTRQLKKKKNKLGDLRYWCYPAAPDGPGPGAQGELPKIIAFPGSEPF
jgi:hypothetical protein